MLRILFVKNDLFIPELYAGTELTTHYLCRHLAERGHHVAVAVRSNRSEFDVGQRAKCDDGCGYSVYRARCFDDAVATSVGEFRPDAVVCQELISWIGLEKFESFNRMAIVLYCHSLDWCTPLPEPIRERAVYLANSVATAAFLKTTYGIDSVIVPPVFGVDRFAGLEPRGNNVLFVGILLRKGADITLQIAAERSNVSFIFVESWSGDPNITTPLRRLAASLPNVRLLPNQPDLHSVFRETRLLLMPSRVPEGWGRTATEAQLCGIPVLGSSRGQLGATIGRGGIALDPDAGIPTWLQAFDSIWSDEEYYRVLSRRAKEHALRLIEPQDSMVERFENSLISAVKCQRLRAASLSL